MNRFECSLFQIHEIDIMLAINCWIFANSLTYLMKVVETIFKFTLEQRIVGSVQAKANPDVFETLVSIKSCCPDWVPTSIAGNKGIFVRYMANDQERCEDSPFYLVIVVGDCLPVP